MTKTPLHGPTPACARRQGLRPPEVSSRDGEQVVCALCDAVLARGSEPARRLWCSGHGRIAEERVGAGPAGSDLSGIVGYTLDAELARGGQGVIYRAHRSADGLPVAIKALAAGPWASPREVDRFLASAEEQARLDDPGVLTVYETGRTAEGLAWCAMELVDGPNLADALLIHGPLDPDDAVAFVLEAARTMHRMHRVGRFHGDLKPTNLLLTPDGEVRVVDFALGDPTEDPARAARVGTPRYMAPEQARGEATDWARVDVFALGVTLFELLGGRFGRAPSGRLTLGTLPEGTPPALRTLVEHATLEDPRLRVPSMARWVDDLSRWRRGADVSARFRDRAVRMRTWSRDRRRELLVASGVLAVLLVILGAQVVASGMKARRTEARVQARWQATLDDIAWLEEAGRREDAVARFQAFAEAPEHQGTRALGQAWIDWARGLESADELDAAREAWAAAVLATDDASVRRRAMDGLIAVHEEAERWEDLGVLLSAVTRLVPDHDPRALEALRVGADLARGDLTVDVAPLPPATARVVHALSVVRDMAPGTPERGAFDVGDHGTIPWVATESRAWSLADEGHVREGCRVLPARHEGVYLACDQSDEHWLVHHAGGEETELHRWPSGRANVVLDAEGYRYMGTVLGDRRLVRLDGEQEILVDEAASQLDNHVVAGVAGDLDGDGDDEVAIAYGPPFGMEVRVYDVLPDGALRSRASQRFGYVEHLAIVTTEHGPRLVASTAQVHATPDLFPRATPHGGPPRLLVLSLVEDGLRVEDTFPLGGSRRVRRLVAADLDGDGREDLAAGVKLGLRSGTLVLAQGADGRLHEPVMLGGRRALAAANLDDDPAMELLAVAEDEGRIVVMGVGHTSPEGPPPVVRPEIDTDEDLLAALGLHGRIARDLELRAQTQPLEAMELYQRAAEAWVSAGEPAQAAHALDLAAHSSVTVDTEVLSRAVDLSIEGMAFGQAEQLARELERFDATVAPARRRWLAALATPSVSLPLEDGPDGSWRAPVPGAVRWSPSDPEVVARVPRQPWTVLDADLRATSDVRWLRLDVDLSRVELGAAARVALRPADGGEGGLSFEVYAYGGRRFVRRSLRCHGSTVVDLDRERFAETDRVEVLLLRGQDPEDLRCRVTVNGRLAGEHRWEAPVRDDVPWELVVEGLDGAPSLAGQLLTLAIHELEAGGVEDRESSRRRVGRPPWAFQNALSPARVAQQRLAPTDLPSSRPDVAARRFALAWLENAAVEPTDPEVQAAMLAAPPLDELPDAEEALLRAARGLALWQADALDEARSELERAAALVDGLPGNAWMAGFRAETLLCEIGLSLGEDDVALAHARAALAWAPEPSLGAALLSRREALAQRRDDPAWGALLAAR